MDLLDRFNGLRALVVGDVMIDAYTKGVVERMSPEAPVPIVNVKSSFDRLGGAANVVLNLKSLGAVPYVCSVIGDDPYGEKLCQLLLEHGVDVGCLVKSRQRRTTVKHRVFNGDKQVLRIDEEDIFDLTDDEHQALWEVIAKRLDSKPFDVIILQDYNKGVLTEKMIQAIVGLARQKNIPVGVDPKKKNFFAYQGVTLFKPNGKELRDGLGVHAETIDELRQSAVVLQHRLNCQYLMVTLSEQGVMILHDGSFHHIPAHPRNIVDVSGAGDTVLSVAALCLALKEDAETIAAVANLAGGLVCEEVGVVSIDKERLRQEVKRIRHE